jgi:hypothetical protein
VGNVAKKIPHNYTKLLTKESKNGEDGMSTRTRVGGMAIRGV